MGTIKLSCIVSIFYALAFIMHMVAGGCATLITSSGPLHESLFQFVPFDDFVNLTSVMDTKRQLARAVLAEIPEQLISYMRSKGYKPRNLGRKQSQISRLSRSATNSVKGETENSNSYKCSDHCNPQSSSPSAPPHPSI